MREQSTRGREDPTDKARREEEWHKQMAPHFHGDVGGQGSHHTTSSSQAQGTTWLRDVHGQWVEVVLAAGPSRERSHQQNHHNEGQHQGNGHHQVDINPWQSGILTSNTSRDINRAHHRHRRHTTEGTGGRTHKGNGVGGHGPPLRPLPQPVPIQRRKI